MSYLVKTKSETLEFFYEKRRGICYRNEFSDTVHLLTEEAEGEMDVYSNEDLHLVCQSKTGELLYFCYRMGGWHRRVLLTSKKEEPCFSHLRLWETQKELRLFYVLEHEGEHLLVCQALDGTPEPLAKISEKKFLLRGDSAGCLYLIYRQGEETLFQTYRYGNWTNPKSLGKGRVSDALFTQPQTAHLAITDHGNLCYAALEEGEIKETIPVTRGEFAPVLLYHENNLWMLYENRGRVFYWKKGQKGPIAMITGSSPEVFHLRVSGGRELARRAYGCRRQNKINLFLCSRIPEETQQKSFSDDCLIELTKLKLRLDSLEQTVKKMQKNTPNFS